MARTVVITGGSRGLGRQVAQRFCELGDRVVITGRSDRVRKTAADLGITGVECDASEPASVEAFAARLDDGVDVLVNMAGGNADLVAPAPESLKDIAAQWNANLSANLLSAVLTTSALRGRLRSGGSLINVGSIGAEYASSSYGAAKAALAAWSAGLSAELAPTGITVNAVCPGYVETPMAQRVRAGYAAAFDTTEDAIHEKFKAKIPLGRYSSPEEVAGLVGYLATDTAASITAQALNVCGGLGNF